MKGIFCGAVLEGGGIFYIIREKMSFYLNDIFILAFWLIIEL